MQVRLTLAPQVIIVADGVHSSSRQLLTSQPDCTGEQELSTGYSIYRSAVSAEKIKLDPRCARKSSVRSEAALVLIQTPDEQTCSTARSGLGLAQTGTSARTLWTTEKLWLS